MSIESPLAIGDWISQTQTVASFKLFQYGWRAQVVDRQTGEKDYLKQTDYTDGVVVLRRPDDVSPAVEVLVPWPSHDDQGTVEGDALDKAERELANKSQGAIADAIESELGGTLVDEKPADIPVGLDDVEEKVEETLDDVALPAPGPSGYQAAVGEGITQVTVRVAPAWGYQKSEAEATLSFPQPRSLDHAQQAIHDLQEFLNELASSNVDALVSRRDQSEGKAAIAPATTSQPTPTASPPPIQANVGDLTWAIGHRPQGRGTFKYLPTSVASTDAVATIALQEAAITHNLPVNQITFHDNRVGGGEYPGLEASPPGEAWSAGVLAATRGTALAQWLENQGHKMVVAYVDFEEPSGNVSVSLSASGNKVVEAIRERDGGQ